MHYGLLMFSLKPHLDEFCEAVLCALFICLSDSITALKDTVTKLYMCVGQNER